MKNNVGNPKAFERAVGDLLNIAGYTVKPETLLGHKKVDLYFEELHLGTMRRVGVECKCYSNVLTKEEVKEIYIDHLPLLENKVIHEILIVTKIGLSPTAQRYVDDSRGLFHLTFTELQNSIMDFRSYILGLINQFSEDGLSNYYVPSKIELIKRYTYDEDSHRFICTPDYIHSGEKDFEEFVEKWLLEAENGPLAILGGYGIGKTTFARRLAYVLAERVLKDSNSRIPILIKLDEMSSGESLEGLLAKLFTAEMSIRNYSFEVFTALNKAGRFVIMLDGFDEMKHADSWEEFLFNLKQINRLVNEDSRVIILGRPTAFLNDGEHWFALHGIRHFAKEDIREPEWPNYHEVHMSLFTQEQVKRFLSGYLTYVTTTRRFWKPVRRLDRLVKFRLSQLPKEKLSDISKRPVTLKMFVDVVPQYRGSLDDLTITTLYSEFIYLMIERELKEKKARLRFNMEDRRHFARQVAWWLWTTKKEMRVALEDIPKEIFENYRKGFKDLESIRRDLVAACFLEKKLDGTLCFPHRSFQEFLVAEHIVTMLAYGETTFDFVDGFVTEEVSNFLLWSVNVETFKSWEKAFDGFRGRLSWKFVRIWLGDEKYGEYLLGKAGNSENPWYLLLLTIGINKKKFANLRVANLIALIIEKMKEIGSRVEEIEVSDERRNRYLLYALLCHLCLAGLSAILKSEEVILSSLAVLCDFQGYALNGTFRKVKTYRPDPVIEEFMSTIVADESKRFINLRKSYDFLCEVLEDYCLISDWIKENTIRTDDISLPLTIKKNNSDNYRKVIARATMGFRKKYV